MVDAVIVKAAACRVNGRVLTVSFRQLKSIYRKKGFVVDNDSKLQVEFAILGLLETVTKALDGLEAKRAVKVKKDRRTKQSKFIIRKEQLFKSTMEESYKNLTLANAMFINIQNEMNNDIQARNGRTGRYEIAMQMFCGNLLKFALEPSYKRGTAGPLIRDAYNSLRRTVSDSIAELRFYIVASGLSQQSAAELQAVYELLRIEPASTMNIST